MRRSRRDPSTLADRLHAEALELERRAEDLKIQEAQPPGLPRFSLRAVHSAPARLVAQFFERAADAYEVSSDALLVSGREEDGLQDGTTARRLRAWTHKLRTAQFFVSKTYENWDLEAREFGETNDRGYEFEDEPMSLRDVFRALRDMGGMEPSAIPLTRENVIHGRVWFYDLDGDEDWRTGDITHHSLHVRGSERAMRRFADALQSEYPEWFR